MYVEIEYFYVKYFDVFFRPQIKIFIEGLFSFDQDIAAFKEHLRDFLVQIRVSLISWLVSWNYVEVQNIYSITL